MFLVLAMPRNYDAFTGMTGQTGQIDHVRKLVEREV
jgi:hypothetical protein